MFPATPETVIPNFVIRLNKLRTRPLARYRIIEFGDFINSLFIYDLPCTVDVNFGSRFLVRSRGSSLCRSLVPFARCQREYRIKLVTALIGSITCVNFKACNPIQSSILFVLLFAASASSERGDLFASVPTLRLLDPDGEAQFA